MSVLFMGGELTSFTPTDSNQIEGTNTANHNPSFARCSLANGPFLGNASPPSGYAESVSWASEANFWFHCELSGGGQTAEYPVLEFFDSGTSVLRLTSQNSSGNRAYTLQYLDGLAAWQDVGSTITLASGLEVFDINFDVSTGVATLYVAGTERASATGLSLGHITGIDKMRFDATGYVHYISQAIAADESTIGWRLLTRYPSASGSDTAWTGGYTDVDETVTSDADFVNTSTADAVETFAQTGPAISGYLVRAVGVYARARRGSTGPQNLQLALRSGGTNYFSSSKALGLGYAAYGNIWDQNPATAADWVNTAVDSLQPGVKAIT